MKPPCGEFSATRRASSSSLRRFRFYAAIHGGFSARRGQGRQSVDCSLAFSAASLPAASRLACSCGLMFSFSLLRLAFTCHRAVSLSCLFFRGQIQPLADRVSQRCASGLRICTDFPPQQNFVVLRVLRCSVIGTRNRFAFRLSVKSFLVRTQSSADFRIPASANRCTSPRKRSLCQRF